VLFIYTPAFPLPNTLDSTEIRANALPTEPVAHDASYI